MTETQLVPMIELSSRRALLPCSVTRPAAIGRQSNCITIIKRLVYVVVPKGLDLMSEWKIVWSGYVVRWKKSVDSLEKLFAMRRALKRWTATEIR